jgi:hypothetical protein
MPDQELRDLADSGEILNPDVLKSQLARMLESPRAKAFHAGFLDSWLNLRSLGDMPPDRDSFAVYYAKDLQNAMKEETRLFLEHLIATDAPCTDFLDADYTFVNKPLAEHYGLSSEEPTTGDRNRSSCRRTSPLSIRWENRLISKAPRRWWVPARPRGYSTAMARETGSTTETACVRAMPPRF